MIKDALTKAMGFSTRKLGDTPTDNIQLTPKKYVDFTISSAIAGVSSVASAVVFPGFVESNAAGTPFPAGWSVVRNSGGNYTVTHNLNTTAYSVVVTVKSALAITIGNINDKSANTFGVVFFKQTAATTWSATDTDFFFELSK